METIENYIRREYLDKEKSMAQIAKELNCGETKIKNYLSRMNISIRPASDYNNITTEDFIKRANKIHRNKYSYEKFLYKNHAEPGIIICPKHGEFTQCSNNHLKGQGCPRCKSSHGENRIHNYLTNKNIVFCPQFKLDNCKDTYKLRFDFAIWINGKLALIEYNGQQHYKQVPRFKNTLEKIQIRDKIKSDFCANNSIPFLVVHYSDLPYVELIVDWFIKSL